MTLHTVIGIFVDFSLLNKGLPFQPLDALRKLYFQYEYLDYVYYE